MLIRLKAYNSTIHDFKTSKGISKNGTAPEKEKVPD